MKNIIVTHAHRHSGYRMETSHMHEEYELFYLVSGKCSFYINDTVLQMQRGDFALIKNGVSHRNVGSGNEDLEKINIYIKPTVFKSLFGEHASKIRWMFASPHIITEARSSDAVESLMKRLDAEYALGGAMTDMLMECYIRELLILLYRYKNSCTYPKEAHKSTVTERAARYIIENYQNNISLDDVSRFVYLSPEYFSKKFKQDTGVGFREYLVNIRLQHAKDLLTTTDMSITEIAFMCGFNSSNYFSNTFAKAMGMPPAKYRAIGKNDNTQ